MKLAEPHLSTKPHLSTARCLSANLLLVCLAASCGGGSSSANTSCPDLSGAWNVTEVVDDTKCGAGTLSESGDANVVQNGCSFTLAYGSQVISGTLSGNALSGTTQQTEQGGVTTGTFNGQLSADTGSATGLASWTYQSVSNTCTGTTQITAHRRSAGDAGPAVSDSGASGLAGSPGVGGHGGHTSDGGLVSDSGVSGLAGSLGVGGLGGHTPDGGLVGVGTGGAAGQGVGGLGGGAGQDAATTDGGSGSNSGLCSLVGTYPATQANQVIAAGSRAYVAEGASGIEILDISNPAQPSRLGGLATTNATRLVLNGSDLYVADGNGGLKVVDVSNPANPQLVATPTLPSSGPGQLQVLKLSGTRLFAAYVGIDTFDATTPAAPVAKGSLSSTFIEDMEVDGTLVYAATADGLSVFSAISLASPFLVSSTSGHDWAHAIAFSSGYAFLGADSGLTVYDVSVPAAPAVAASTGVVSSIQGLTLQGSTLYVSGKGPGLNVMDVSNPKTPRLVGKCGETLVGSPENMTISGSYGLIAGGSAGVIIVRLSTAGQSDAGVGSPEAGVTPGDASTGPDANSNTSACSLVGFYAAPTANHVIVSGSHAYIAEGSSGIEILDISNPALPSLAGSLPTTNASHLAINGSDLYVADGASGLKVIDVSNPANPQLVATPALPTGAPSEIQTLVLNGTSLYVAYVGLDTFDATTPAAPVAKGSLSTTFIQDLAVDGNLVYAATADGLDVFSTLSLASPFLAGSKTTNDWGHAIAISPGYAFYGSQSALTVIDVSTPSAPSVAGSSGAVTSINGLTVHGNYLYVSGKGPGLTVMDISNPRAPTIVGKCGDMLVGSPQSMTISGALGFVAGGTGGVVIVNLNL